MLLFFTCILHRNAARKLTRVLDCSFEELSAEALKSTNPRQISKQCSVFAESEVISLVNNNVPLCDISAGIHESIARRIHGMIFKVGLVPDVALTGGCAQNPALVVALEKILKVKLASLPVNPQIMGMLKESHFLTSLIRLQPSRLSMPS